LLLEQIDEQQDDQDQEDYPADPVCHVSPFLLVRVERVGSPVVVTAAGPELASTVEAGPSQSGQCDDPSYFSGASYRSG
jgi:hypothetical protein